MSDENDVVLIYSDKQFVVPEKDIPFLKKILKMAKEAGINQITGIYDQIPKFTHARERKGTNLPTVWMETRIGNILYRAEIVPARIEDGSGNAIDYYPGPLEAEVEQALRSLAFKKSDITFENGRLVASFSLRELCREMRGNRNRATVAHALEILCRASIILRSRAFGSEKGYIDHFVKDLTYTTEKAGTSDRRTKFKIALHCMVARDLNRGTYRFLDYEDWTTLTPLARHILEFLTHNFIPDPKIPNRFEFNITSLIANQGFFPNTSFRKIVPKIRKALEELRAAGILAAFEDALIHEEKKKRQPVKDMHITVSAGHRFQTLQEFTENRLFMTKQFRKRPELHEDTTPLPLSLPDPVKDYREKVDENE